MTTRHGRRNVFVPHFLGALILYIYYFTKFTTLVILFLYRPIYLPFRNRKSAFSGDITCAVIHVAFFSLGHSSPVKMYVQSFSTSVLSTDLDIHFGPLSHRSFASLVLIKRTEVDKDRNGRGPKWL